jgi:cystathionine beta-lyase/cystathionine gamma-synthase
MTLDPSKLRPATRLVHGGVQRSVHGETAEALFLTSGYVYDDAEQAEATFAGTVEHYQYSRFANPTLTMLEERLCLIEGAEACRTTATGMAAVNAALLSHLKTGDRVVASRALFGSCHWIVSTLLPKFGIETGVRGRRRSGAMARGVEQAQPTWCCWKRRRTRCWNRRPARGRRPGARGGRRSSWWTMCSRRRCCSSR